MGVCNCSMFCCTLLYFHSSIAIILMGKRNLVALLNLSSWCLVMVEWLFLAVPWGCLQFVIVVFPDHTHLLILLLLHSTIPLLPKFEISSHWQSFVTVEPSKCWTWLSHYKAQLFYTPISQRRSYNVCCLVLQSFNIFNPIKKGGGVTQSCYESVTDSLL